VSDTLHEDRPAFLRPPFRCFGQKLSYGLWGNERENEGVCQTTTYVSLACVCLYEAFQLVEFLRNFRVIEAFHFLVDGSTGSRDNVQQMAQQSVAIRGVSW
jgi:hypothetical protein